MLCDSGPKERKDVKIINICQVCFHLQHLFFTYLAHAVPATYAAGAYSFHGGDIGHRAFRDIECDHKFVYYYIPGAKKAGKGPCSCMAYNCQCIIHARSTNSFD